MTLRCHAPLLLAIVLVVGSVVGSPGSVCPNDETFGPWKAGPNGRCYKAVKVLPGKVSLSLCAEDVCAPMGGTLAEVPDTETNKFVYSLIVESGIYSALIGLYRPPVVDKGLAYQSGWSLASGNNDTGYRQWASWQTGGPFDRCAIVMAQYQYGGSWLGVACSKHHLNDGCLCQSGSGGREPPAVERLVQELQEPELVNRVTATASAAMFWVFWTVFLSFIVPYILSRLFKPSVRWLAAKFCSTEIDKTISTESPIGHSEGGNDGSFGEPVGGPTSSLNSDPTSSLTSSFAKSRSIAAFLIGVDSTGTDTDNGDIVIGGKRIPHVVIAICDGLDWTASACNVCGESMMFLVQIAMISTVWTFLYYTVDFGGDAFDATLAHLEYMAVVLPTVLVCLVAAFGIHLVRLLLGSLHTTCGYRSDGSVSDGGGEAGGATGGSSGRAAIGDSGRSGKGSSTGGELSLISMQAAAEPDVEATTSAASESQGPRQPPHQGVQARHDAALAEAERCWKPTPAYKDQLRRVQLKILAAISSGVWGTSEECEAVLKKVGLVLDVVVEQEQTSSRSVIGSTRVSINRSGRGSRSLMRLGSADSVISVEEGRTRVGIPLKTLVKELHSLLMRYPLEHAAMGEVLAEHGFRWVDKPRRSTPGMLNKRFVRWKDTAASAADSAIFTATGFWMSPGLVPTCYVMGAVAFLVYTPALMESPTNMFLISGVLTGGFGFAIGFNLSRGDRTTAKRLCLVQAVVWIFGWGIATPAFQLMGILSRGAAVLGWGGAGILIGLVFGSEYSFGIFYCGMTLTFTVAAIVLSAYPETTAMAGFMAFHSANLLLKRLDAIALANRIIAKDADAYEVLWRAKCAAPGATESFKALGEAWAEVMGVAVDELKEQPAAFRTVEALFNACDRLNELFTLKLLAICEAHGGVFHRANVKGEERALQKVYRSYKGNFRRLTDLNRCGLCFDSFDQMAACLRAIGAHPDIVVLSMDERKMRFNEAYDATLSSGYRDINITVRINTNWTRMQGLAGILCEVQLHDAGYYHRKSTGGGHQAYVEHRNMLAR